MGDGGRGARKGASWVLDSTSPHLGLKGLEGRGRPIEVLVGPCGFLARSGWGWDSYTPPPPSSVPLLLWAPPTGGRDRASPARALQSCEVRMPRAVETIGARGPRGPLLSRPPPSLAQPFPRSPCARCPSLASGSLLSGRAHSALPSSAFLSRIASPGRERAIAACGCCSNEKSEQLNRKIWIKKLEFNTHAPHLLKH